MISIFNKKKLLEQTSNLPLEDIKDSLEQIFNIEENINIIFLSAKKIKQLNNEYRKKDEVTDVLSFNIDTSDTLGEIYICPEYIIKNTDKGNQLKQFIRIFIHGILHLQGYDHNQVFQEVDYKEEPMYIKQEEILDKILTTIEQK
jgi:probable rRNA maturation factor